jgi:hypothetical protein
MVNHPHRSKAKNGVVTRTSQGLRDILFDEIEELKTGKGDTQKSMAIANLAKQIVNTAKVELDFHRQMAAQDAAGTPVKMGTLELGSGVASAARLATGA